MKNIFFVFCFLFSFVLFAQVGIGTTFPDPSSILDISSTNQGLLAPRMTTAQRLAIISPANGLLVYDLTENIFYFFQDDSWQQLNATQMRTNYKLVQSVADLAAELTAGGGSKYLLNTDFLYEINGTIVFDFPIDLNGAYIEGVDSSEDILVNNSSGSLFEGSKGGGLRNLTLSGSPTTGVRKQLFNITNATGELLLINSTVIAGASKVGTLSGFGTIFLSVTQYVGNGNGFTVSDVESFFVSNVFWTASNTSTFMELTGTFSDLQMNGGRIEINAGEIGVDVSSNPTISNGATLAQLSFVGEGTLVDGYTTGSYPGFKFTKEWNVNCSGILTETDDVATGDINFNFTAGGGARTSFTGNQVPVKLAGSTTSNSLLRFESSGNNRIIYRGKKTRFFNITSSISFEGSANADRLIFYIAKGKSTDAIPAIVDETGVWRRIGSVGDIGAVPLVGTVKLEPGDYIEVWAERFSGTGDIFTVSLNLAIR